MPVRNAAETVDAAIISLLAQTHDDFRLIISDNASTDETGEICQAYAAREPRVEYVRQPRDLDQIGNFRFVLEAADSPFFMWACGDDLWDPTFAEKNVAVLEADPELGSSVSLVRFQNEGQFRHLSQSTFPLAGSVRDNIARYLDDLSDNTRVFGVYRRQHLVDSYPDRLFAAWDYGLVAGTLRFGKHHVVPEVLLTRDLSAESYYHRRVSYDNPAAIDRIFPLLPLTRYLRSELRIPLDVGMIGVLFRMNLRGHRAYARVRWPRYGRLLDAIGPFYRAFARRGAKAYSAS
jgi:glycosyltransferase involved in cell wall biosynthesis